MSIAPPTRPVAVALLVFTGCMVPHSGLRGDEAWRFVDLSERLSGPRAADPANDPRFDYGPMWGDLDGDGRVDLVFLNHGDSPSLYLNRGDGSFVDHFAKSGLRNGDWQYPQQADRHGGACADFDNDGDIDLFITHGAMRGETLGVKYDELLINQGDGTFVEVSHQAGTLNPHGRARTPMWVDYNQDGWLDLLIGNWLSPGVLLRNRGDGTFVDVSAETGLAAEDSAHPSWADYDGDGDPDLLTLWPVTIRRNEGKGYLVRLPGPESPGYPAVQSPVATAWGDFDGDGQIDVFIASRIAGRSRLFRNEAGSFHRAPTDLGMNPEEGGAGAAWGDLDNDGDLDLVVLGTEHVRLLENSGPAGFVSHALTDSHLRPGVDGDVDLADFDGDGRLDLAINAEDGQHLFHNQTAGGSWMIVSLRGTASNADGFGAAVSVHAQGASALMRQHLGDTGFHKSVGCSPLQIGLGDRITIELATIWPSGRRMKISGVPVRRHLVLVEPQQ